MANTQFHKQQVDLERGMSPDRNICRFCNTSEALITRFYNPPNGETDFGFTPYFRSLWQCHNCLHITNKHNFNIDLFFYKNNYRQATYKEESRSRFVKLMALPISKSDNRQRVAFIDNFWRSMKTSRQRSCLDIGSGLGVFPAALSEANWNCVALDPDPEACKLIKEMVGVKTLLGDLMSFENIGKFDLVTFNKVLEHTKKPEKILLKSQHHLKNDGLIYIELPDGETALSVEGPEREEFFIEHYDAYSLKSLELFLNSVNFHILTIDRVHEPSGKYTLRAFAKPR